MDKIEYFVKSDVTFAPMLKILTDYAKYKKCFFTLVDVLRVNDYAINKDELKNTIEGMIDSFEDENEFNLVVGE